MILCALLLVPGTELGALGFPVFSPTEPFQKVCMCGVYVLVCSRADQRVCSRGGLKPLQESFSFPAYFLR